MFEFGRDLKRLFAHARSSDDLGWLELVGVDLVETEARAQSTDAGRVSCSKPFEGWLRASALWREHARRTGRRLSLDKAFDTAADAIRLARSPDEKARAAISAATCSLLNHELFGDPGALALADTAISAVGDIRRAGTAAAVSAVHARMAGRRARAGQDPAGLLDAAALMDAALHDVREAAPHLAAELQLDRAALTLEAGVVQRDARLLDQAGRDLAALVESAPEDERPLTRARALTLCGSGMAALAALAGNAEAARQGREMFDAAAEQFTPDHSPLDWACIVVARAGREEASSAHRLQAEAILAEPGLVLGAEARSSRASAEIALAEGRHDLEALERLKRRARDQLVKPVTQPLDWAVEQICLAEAALALGRMTGPVETSLGLALYEAADVAREWGGTSVADRADRLRREVAAA